jgi:hypothetical protein
MEPSPFPVNDRFQSPSVQWALRPLPALGRFVVRAIAVAYLVGFWLDGAGCDYPHRLPGAISSFLEVAALFPDAAISVTEYRAEGWLCDEHRWEEIDTRPYFPLRPDDKENRFQRALHFYHDEPIVTRALDAYLVGRHNAGQNDDGIPRPEAIGGVRFILVKAPLPRPGAPPERYVRQSLSGFAGAELRPIYATPENERAARCGHEPTPGRAP